MSQTGDAAEQVVNMAANVTLKGAEVVGNMTGKALLSLATFLIAAARSQKRTKGKTRMRSFNGKPTKVFVIRQKDLPEFARQAREYGVLYAAVVNRRDNSPDGLVDVVVNANDAAKVNRIADRFALSAVDVDKIKDDILKSREQKEQRKGPDAEKQRAAPPDEKTFTMDEETLSEMLGEPQKQNPTMAGTEIRKENPSAPLSERSSRSEYEQERPSQRVSIARMKEERRAAAMERNQPKRQRQRTNRHRQPTPKRNTKGGR
jgi:hypothetical protein